MGLGALYRRGCIMRGCSLEDGKGWESVILLLGGSVGGQE